MAFQYRQGDRPLPGYTIERGVGRGAFGEVYYATSDGGKEVALKYLRDNPQIELRGVSHCLNLKSPHLVDIHDVKQNADGDCFVVMEYVHGASLRDLMNSEPGGLGPQKSAYLVREIAKGLIYLHDRGIVHRDMKPGNIFYEDGYVKIGDYGLAKLMAASQHSGQTMSVGTVHYMAPEVGSGNYDRTIDVYALGVMLYEMLLGRVPFAGATMGEVLMKHLTAQPDVDKLPAPFPNVIRKALAKDPKDRYQTVQEMVADLFAVSDLDRSVAAFEPASLSMAANRMARHLQTADATLTAGAGARVGSGPLGTGSSNMGRNVPPPPIPPPVAGGGRLFAAGDRAANGSRLDLHRGGRVPVAEPRDSIEPKGRRSRIAALTLALLVTSAVSAVITRIDPGGLRLNRTVGVSVFLFIAAYSAGALIGGWLSIDRLRLRRGWARRAVLGACISCCVGLFWSWINDNAGAFVNATTMKPASSRVEPGGFQRYLDSWIFPLMLSAFCCNWRRRIQHGRQTGGRIEAGHAVSAGLFTLVVALVTSLNGSALAVAGIVAGASLIVELLGAWWSSAEATVSAGSGDRRPWRETLNRGRAWIDQRVRVNPGLVGQPMATTVEAQAGAAQVEQSADALRRSTQRVAGAGPSSTVQASAESGPRNPFAAPLWLFLSAALVCASVLLFCAPAFLGLESDSKSGCIVAGVVTSSYFLFALSRIFGGRRIGFWRGIVRPFLCASGLAMAGGAGAAWGLFHFRGADAMASLAAILIGGFLALGIWMVPSFDRAVGGNEPVSPELLRKRRRGQYMLFAGAMGYLLIGFIVMLLVSNVAGSDLEDVIPAVVIPLGIISSVFMFLGVTGVWKSPTNPREPRQADRKRRERLSLPLRRTFDVNTGTDFQDRIERHCGMLGYRLTSRSHLLWTFERGVPHAQFWASDIRKWKTHLNIAAYDHDAGGLRVNCHLDLDSSFNSPSRKNLAQLDEELTDLRGLLGGREGQVQG